ncbi:hypothetical protein DHEL01_v207165 [Diaporthe helianthi]|uniref:Uncharacterized protein n=1 Tax=Diaporthe helianthi TaxID=158607 RepID=A0A2P5HW05_DIAHE|nr:hypothetical protein DHEL01_v207165 [Diaporthe helianthi]
MAPTGIIGNSVPVRYDSRVVVKPCQPDRVPHLPEDILFMIAKALPQPKQVFHLALASKNVWELLQPALYECEVTYEARLAQKYDMENRKFRVPLPKLYDQFHIVGGSSMTALHWAALHGPSAMPVAEKAIRAALTHQQPSYINGLNLMKRCFTPFQDYSQYLSRFELVEEEFADHPPPLFLAAAHGNLELLQALNYAGADMTLLLGRTIRRDIFGSSALVCSKIHQQCFPSERWSAEKCLFEEQLGSEYAIARDGDFLACQSIGHVVLEFEQTEMLQFLLQNGLDVQLGTRHLLHSAVLAGNLAAVKVLLAHDPSLVHTLHMGSTPLHVVPFMENKAGLHCSEEEVESMVSCLLEHGANLEATAEEFEIYSKYSEVGFAPLDSAFLRTRYARLNYSNGHGSLTALRAANVFLNKGARWLPPSSDGHGGPLASRHDRSRFFILKTCLENAVLLVQNEYAGDQDLRNSMFNSTRYRSLRKLWAQTCKNLIGKASEALPGGTGSDNNNDRDAVQEMLHDAFRYLVDHAGGQWQREGIVGWWALEAVGNLLLSTGLKPCGRSVRDWERILKRDYEVVDGNSKSIEECEAIDGDKSEWAFLLEDITPAKPEAAFFPKEHSHY